jgi:2-polyprenyl-3-methyl-5-hydroxy-6-metoxy-1,4-benzoquinol methylase
MNLRWRIAQYFELRWWKNYLHKKDTETYLQQKHKYWMRIYNMVSQHLKINNTHKILDLGCGPSGIYMLFPKNEVTAVDPLINAYENKLQVFSKSLYPNTTFINTTIEAFKNIYQYDIVFCMNAINHVSDITLAYQKLKSCTKQHGKMLVSIDAHNHSIFRFLFRLMPGDILHPHQYNLNEYQQFAETHNFKILDTLLIKKGFFFNHYMMLTEKI